MKNFLKDRWRLILIGFIVLIIIIFVWLSWQKLATPTVLSPSPSSLPNTQENPTPISTTKNTTTSQEETTPSSSAIPTSTPVSLPVTKYFYSDFCHWCQQEKSIVQQLESEGYPFSWMSVDTHANYWADFSLSGTPTFIIGSSRLEGYRDYDILKSWIDQHK